MTQQALYKDTGVRVHHIALLFEKNRIFPTYIYYIAEEISNFIRSELQNIYCIHLGSDNDNEHVHIHIAINPVSYIDRHKFNYNYSYFTPLSKQLEGE